MEKLKNSSVADKLKLYTTDSKVNHFSKKEDINEKLAKIIGPKFTEYRKKWNAANKLKLVTDFPLFIHIELNQKCNYQCPHCIIGDQKLVDSIFDEKENIKFQQYKKIVDEGSEHGCPSISPQGNNEPYLNKHIEDYMYYAYKKNYIDIMINCNASALTDRRIQKTLDSGLTRIRFSLDAFSSDMYKKVRVGSLPLEKVERNIHRFLDLKEKGGYKLPLTGVSFCKLSTNVHEADDFVNKWKDIVDQVSLQTFIPPKVRDDYSQYYTEDQFVDKPKTSFKCVQPFQRVVIRNQSITPCCSNDGMDISIGDLRFSSIYESWNSSMMNNLRKLHVDDKFYDNEVCKACVSAVFPVKNLN
jgi:MoaA/NifB/PqqE/SkfB family radical SAM enzyme